MVECTNIGTLYGIGVGPGDPELMSLKGLRCIQQCAIVAYPAGQAGKAGIAEHIIEPWLTSQQRLPLCFPFVENPAQLQQAWQQAALSVWQYLSQGQDIAFACEGDVGVYSTFTYLADTLLALHPQVPIKRIPGISSPMAAAAALNIPLTYQQEQLAIIPALQHLDTLSEALDWAKVVVLLKVSRVYAQVWQLLQEKDLLETSYVITQASQPQQQIYQNLSQYPNLQLPYFSLMMITRRRPKTDKP